MKIKLLPPAFLLLILSLTSCTTISMQGQSINESELSELQNKRLSQDEVAELVGTPTIFDPTIEPYRWYYVERIMSKKAFFEPKIIEQKIVRVDFDESGFSKDVLLLENSYREGISIEREYTETKGTETNQFQKFFKNFGRFNKAKKGKRVKGARR